VPAKGCSPELAWLVDQQQDELESVRKADEVKLGRRGKGDRRVAAIKRAAEAGVG